MWLSTLKLPWNLTRVSVLRTNHHSLSGNGLTLDDSELILQHLEKLSNGGLYGQLSRSEMAVGTAFSRLTDNHLYWMVVASPWLEDDWFANVKQGFFGNIPPLIGPLISTLARRQVRQTYNLHGLATPPKSSKFVLLGVVFYFTDPG